MNEKASQRNMSLEIPIKSPTHSLNTKAAHIGAEFTVH